MKRMKFLLLKLSIHFKYKKNVTWYLYNITSIKSKSKLKNIQYFKQISYQESIKRSLWLDVEEIHFNSNISKINVLVFRRNFQRIWRTTCKGRVSFKATGKTTPVLERKPNEEQNKMQNSYIPSSRLNCVFDIFDILRRYTKSCNKQFIKWTKITNVYC